jgi:hypothetical protein
MVEGEAVQGRSSGGRRGMTGGPRRSAAGGDLTRGAHASAARGEGRRTPSGLRGIGPGLNR